MSLFRREGINESDERAPHAGGFDPKKRFIQVPTIVILKLNVKIVRSFYALLDGRWHIEKVSRLHIEDTAEGMEAACRNTIYAAFVLLDLLKAHTYERGETLLRQTERFSAFAKP